LDYGGGAAVSEGIRAVHGHFPVIRYADDFPDARVIGWLRHPVERIISYYFYWKKSPPHGNASHELFVEEDMSLLEFAEFEPIRNEVFGTYLKDFAASRFFFLGIMERYEEDLERLAKLMNWSLPELPKVNVNRLKLDVDDQTRHEISRIYQEEIDLYEMTLSHALSH